MRFATSHKAATYLMVAFAYLAMAGGGGMPPVMVLAGIGALIASWWWEAPRIDLARWSWVWTVGSVLALAYAVLAAITTGDYLGVGGQFLTWLVIAKAFTRRALRDWQQLYLLSFLMLVAGSVLNAELSYGLCFLGFVIATTWALTLFHLRREMEDNLLVKHAANRETENVQVQRILDSKRVVGARFFVGTGGLSLGVFLVAAAIFLALPRVGIGFFLKGKSGLTLTGFSDGVQLGGHGVIKSDPTVVMRVEIAPELGNRGAPSIHWRGVAFDQYRHGQWTRSKISPETQQSYDISQIRDRRFLAWDGKHLQPPSDDELPGSYAKQSIWLEPLDSDVLFGAGRPRVVEYPHILRRTPVAEHNDEMRVAHGSTLHYTVYSELARPSAETLRAAPPSDPHPKNFSVYLQLESDITPRTKELALSITKGLTNNYDKANAIVKWLDDNLSYTLELADPGAQEPVDFFLFDRKKGHCEYFASAFAILARENGIMVRNVNGFLGGEWNEYQSYVAVRAGDAHSWDEVYFPTVGWVTFDPTPSASIDELGRGGSGPFARLGRFLDTLKFQWAKWVIEYDLSSQIDLFKSIGRAVKAAALSIKDAIVAAKNALVHYWYLSLLAVAGIGTLLYRRYRKRGRPLPLAFLRPRGSRPRSTVAEQFLALSKVLAKAGYPREPGITPRELATRMRDKKASGGAELAELVELYYAAEWGAVRDPAAEDRAAKLVIAIRAALESSKRASR